MAGRPLWGDRRRQSSGQSLTEFAIVLPVFMLLFVGLFDGTRVIFYNSQIQEAAREGARWGSVEVARAVTDSAGNTSTPWGTFDYLGNAAGYYCDYSASNNPSCPTGGTTVVNGTTMNVYPLQASRTITGTTTETIVGATLQAANAVDPRQVTIIVSTGISVTTAMETAQISPYLTNQYVSVTVTYPFKPLLSMIFAGATMPLQGTSTMLHE
ncbi:MAG TPA: TadE/TadG family type IV pilus assembly protein [Chloroflexota bacterium]|nr:TadE/TadG family type IV pilus assembly protein [Chloroflexota bacterium]